MSHFYTIMATAKEDLNTDYSTSASKQLTISEESAALVCYILLLLAHVPGSEWVGLTDENRFAPHKTCRP